MNKDEDFDDNNNQVIDDSEIMLLDNKFKENIILTIIKSIKSNFNPPKTPPNKLFRRPK